MKKEKNLLSIDEYRREALSLLIKVAEFCEKNDIKYYLACGTLLGAIRHKGFIPWDNDVDIMMPRPDYNKFMNSFADDRYKVLKPSEGRLYFAKVYDTKTIKYEEGIDYKKYEPTGVDIDVFPLDGIINDEAIVNKLYKKSQFLELLLKLSNQPLNYRKNPIKIINRLLPRLIGSKNIVSLIEKNAQTYDYQSSDYVIRMRHTPNGFTGALPKSVYDEPIKKEFERHYFYIPRDYDKWLKTFYGDYMKLPSEENRRIHKYECYWR